MPTPNDAAGTTSQVVNSRNPEGHDLFNIVRRERQLCTLVHSFDLPRRLTHKTPRAPLCQNTLSPDELGKLLDNDYDLDVDLDIPENLFGPDGDLNMNFDGDYGDAHLHHANSAPVHSPIHGDANRSVLASMDSAQLGEQSIHMHHAHSAPTHVFPNPGQFVQQVQQPIYIRDQAGNFIQITTTLPVAGMAGSAGQNILSGVPFQQPHIRSEGVFDRGDARYHVQQSSMVPSNDPLYAIMPMNDCGSVQNSPVKGVGKKRGARKKKGPPETVQQQRVRADKGFTEHPKSSQLMRHGEALKAYTKDNKEIPAIKDIFAVFAKNEGFTGSPPPVVNIEARAGGPLCSNLVRHQLEAEMRAEEASAQPVERTQAIGVTRDEWSLFWKAHVERATGTSDRKEGVQVNANGNGNSEAGVPDAEAGAMPDAIFCGEFPTVDQAARGYDVMAIKIHGESAALNFPLDNYKGIMKLINSRTEAELLQAILKDAELACQRTSKFKGVRRTGPHHYEATVDTEMVTRALNQKAKSGKKKAPAAKRGVEAPEIQHCTSSFHA